MTVALDFDDVLERGGERLISFLHFCVYSVAMTPLFVFLAREYRFRPTVAGALALYDNFCAVDAPARLKADAILAPRDGRLDQLISRLRREQQLFEEAAGTASPADAVASTTGHLPAAALPSPVLFLFDRVVQHLREDDARALHAVARAFNPSHEPMENLPGGKLNAGQRAFLENVWRPRVRPHLVAAGFWRAANLGQ
jgi:hypothetical protein